jgi:hypothetical protein
MPLWSALIARPQSTPLSSRPSLTLYFLLTGAFLLTLLPVVLQFPPWLTVAICAAAALRSVVEVYRLPLPSSTFCGIVAILLFVLVWLQFGVIVGRAPGTAVTAGLLAIKFYEIRRPRDISLIIFACFFLMMSALLFSQVLELFIYCLIMMWVLTALLMRVQAGDRPTDGLLLVLSAAGAIFLQAIPLALMLFFFFPRINGPLGFTLTEPPIGLTDRVAPGSVAKLAQDDTPAMYVHFNSRATIPAFESMYWRAVVLYDYRDGVFTTGDVSERLAPPHETRQPDPSHIEQVITIRTNNQRWLYALDCPITKPLNTAESSGWGDLYEGDTIRLVSGKLDHFARYTVVSAPFRQEETISREEWNAATELPAKPDELPVSEPVKKLADQLYQQARGNESAYVSAVLRYFHQGGFVYSIDLPEQARDWLTEFLMVRRTGYCEHFASAFAVLMRLEHIPARLVAGYLGGSYNPYTDDYTVTQSTAHAWDEVWMPGPGDPRVGRWVRVDPTALAASSNAGRLDSAAQGDTEMLRIQQRPESFADHYFPAWMKSGMREVRLRREQLETNWDTVVLSYDTDTQFRLAQVLGLGLDPGFGLLLVCVAAAAVCALGFWRWLAKKPRISPVEYLYGAFCRNMARRGIPRAAWEGPMAYTERVAEAFPEEKPVIRNVGELVARARYGPVPADNRTIQQLETALAVISAAQVAGSSREKA